MLLVTLLFVVMVAAFFGAVNYHAYLAFAVWFLAGFMSFCISVGFTESSWKIAYIGVFMVYVIYGLLTLLLSTLLSWGEHANMNIYYRK